MVIRFKAEFTTSGNQVNPCPEWEVRGVARREMEANSGVRTLEHPGWEGVLVLQQNRRRGEHPSRQLQIVQILAAEVLGKAGIQPLA
jgi:hypothetical protein